MYCRPIIPLIFLAGFLLGSPVRLAAQQSGRPVDSPRRIHLVSALRMQAMLRSPAAAPALPPRASLATPDAMSHFPVPAVQFTGRSIRVPLTGPLDLRAGVSWWSSGLRTSAGFCLRF
jgi:hypothetical protein